MGTKDEYVNKMKAQLGEWSSKIDKIQAQADKAEADAKIKYHEELNQLRNHKEAALEKLDKVTSASENAWEELKTGLDNSWDELKIGIESAASKFK
jgi:hypothetical protein